VELKTLSLGDEAALERFLLPRTESSLFLRSNARAAGLSDRGKPLQGTYVAAIGNGEITAVAAHFWNGMLVLQAPESSALEPVARAAVSRSGRELTGLAGPDAQVRAARLALGLAARPTKLDSREALFSLDLSRLRVAEALASGRVECRPPRADELDLVSSWRKDYSIEALGFEDGRKLRENCRAEVRRLQERRSQWVLVGAEGRPVSYSAFNARLPDVVQVGGVWTPEDLRGRGYGRCVVAGTLLEARAEGVETAVLFTGEENVSARAAYEALGFRVVGDYALVLFS
jgi:RimJ/RimL family protein N-acetyltransferase